MGKQEMIKLDIFESIAYLYAMEIGADEELIFELKKLQAIKKDCNPENISEFDVETLKKALVPLISGDNNVDDLVEKMLWSYHDAQQSDFI